jgi:predicted regulator of amino acid metabolism with ACT domain
MWQEILDKFKRFPAQEKVIRLILQRGFQINDASRVVSGRIEIPHAQIAKELDVDRRVVDTTAQAIRDDENLWKVFKNVRSMTFLGDVAPILGYWEMWPVLWPIAAYPSARPFPTIPILWKAPS